MVQLLPGYAPDPHVAEPGCIRHQSPTTELDEAGTHSRMPACAALTAELTGPERVLRLERVHETGFSNAPTAGQCGDPLTELLGELIHARLQCANPQHVISERQVYLFESFATSAPPWRSILFTTITG